MCRVNSCCCGCTLATGAIVCCVFTGIGALANLGYGGQILSAVSSAERPSDVSPNDWKTAKAILNGVGGFSLFSGALSAVAFICLLIGIGSKRAGCVMVWLVIDMIYIVCSGILALLLCVAAAQYIAYGIGGLIGMGISIYLWIVVLSYYHELNEQGGGQIIASNPKGYV